MQEHKSIAFLSQALKGKALHMSTYEKELFALVTAIQKWRPYVTTQGKALARSALSPQKD